MSKPATQARPQAVHLAFVDGRFDAPTSAAVDLPDGLSLRPLQRTVEDGAAAATDSAWPARSGTGLPADSESWLDGLVLSVDDGVSLEAAIELHYGYSGAHVDGSAASCVRLEVGAAAAVTLVEVFPQTGHGSAPEVPVVEIRCAASAAVDHLKILTGDADVTTPHTGTTYVHQRRDSRYASREYVAGGRDVRREIHVDLVESGAECDLRALYVGDDRQRRDLRTRVRHGAPGCRTKEVYKGVLAGESRGDFDGLILVDRDAQQTEAYQTNRNLLLSDDATAGSTPRLEIYADDVKCSHGSTTGSLDDEQLFYLRSRGFAAAEARVMLAKAFAGEILDGFGDPELQARLGRDFAERLAASHALEVQ